MKGKTCIKKNCKLSNLTILGTCMVYAYVFEDRDTFLQGHNQLCIPVMY